MELFSLSHFWETRLLRKPFICSILSDDGLVMQFRETFVQMAAAGPEHTKGALVGP